MIDRSEVVVHLVLGDEGRYVVDAVLRLPYFFPIGAPKPRKGFFAL